ncbi:cytochrome c3 family protein [Holophaga foetida]|uniref:cytochrome c3 family protein n=1 Tax=Holophaga foetida TaxID=35839 RepID=UPI00024725D3|nr:cytochrome c3 family protein [Holophaga foetida]
MKFPSIANKLVSLACALMVGACLLAAPKRLATAKPGQCKACHSDKPVLPKDHTDTKGLSLADCQGCHEKGSKTSLVGKLPLMHAHQMKGVTCTQCHGKGKPEAVDKAKCVSCHEQKALTEKTSKLKPQNPHESPHGYQEDCNLCHHQHTKSENFCATCHAFDFSTP